MKWLYKIIKFLVRTFYPKIDVVGLKGLPDEPVVFVGNHSQLHGPVTAELYFNDDVYTWCAGQMMELGQVPEYAFNDFWSQKPKRVQWYYKLCSYIIAPLSVLIFNNARTIPVYHDKRVISTFKNTIKLMQQGKSVIIFPEHDVKHNNIVCDFQSAFVSIGKLYFKRTGKALKFVPIYIAPKLKKVYVGDYIEYDTSAELEAENKRICEYLMEEISQMAYSLPLHTVVPYRNMPKKLYPQNTAKKVDL